MKENPKLVISVDINEKWNEDVSLNKKEKKLNLRNTKIQNRENFLLKVYWVSEC